ncbi:MAG: PorT family protein [Ignavibacteriaceae bacterium]|nr:PorT family protein [Ignavibacteriaceae bacterium]
MKNFVFIFFLFFSLVLSAQQKSFQFEIGLNQSWFTFDMGILNDIKPNIRPKISIALNREFYKYGNIAATGGLRFYDLGRAITIDLYALGNVTSTIDHYLISVPLQVKYRIGLINTSVILNVEPSYILASKTYAPGLNTEAMIKSTITNEMNRFLFLVGGGLEYTFAINNEMFGIKSITNYCLTQIPKDGTFLSSDNVEHGWVAYKAVETRLALSYYF